LKDLGPKDGKLFLRKYKKEMIKAQNHKKIRDPEEKGFQEHL